MTIWTTKFAAKPLISSLPTCFSNKPKLHLGKGHAIPLDPRMEDMAFRLAQQVVAKLHSTSAAYSKADTHMTWLNSSKHVDPTTHGFTQRPAIGLHTKNPQLTKKEFKLAPVTWCMLVHDFQAELVSATRLEEYNYLCGYQSLSPQ